MKLTRQQRDAIFAGQAPRLSGEGKCPVEAGHKFNVSPNITVEVLEIRRTRMGDWSLHYHIFDRRDPTRNLRRTPGIQNFEQVRSGFDEYGYPPAHTPQDTPRGDAIASAYTSASSSLSDAGEGVRDASLDRFVERAQEGQDQREKAARRQRENLELERRIMAYQDEARLRRLDMRSEFRTAARLKGPARVRQVQAIRRKLDGTNGMDRAA